jgi:opacity protein-like surface antigen
MNAIRTKILAGAAALAVAFSAWHLSAQPDYYYYGPYPAPPAPPASDRYYAPLSGKLYLGFDVGVAFQQDITLSDSIGDNEKVTFDPGARLDFQLGYNFTSNWATEVELGLVISPVAQSYVLGADFMGVDYTELPVMVNVIYTRPLGRRVSVYLGGGIGGVFSQYSNDFGGSTPTDSAFGFQALAGIKYAISDRWDFGIAYKFLGTTEHDVGPGFDSNGFPTEFKSDGTLTHAVLVTLTCKF